MTDQTPHDDFSRDNTPGDQPHEASASSIFLEMMRQQAAQQQPPPPPTPAENAEAHQPEPTPPPPPAPASDTGHETAREQLRVQRVQRRRRRRYQQTTGLLGGIFRTLFTVSLTAVITATIFTWWQRPEFLSAEIRSDLSIALATATNQGVMVQATALPVTPNWMRRIGIVSGHRGPEDDPGAVCPDGLTEAEINLSVAERVVRSLQARGYTVDLLDEFDPRLSDYKGDMLLSIHANTCQDYGEVVSGYLISTADARASSGNDQLLVECVAAYYGEATELQRRFGLTRDMTDYHIFRQIHPRTPGAIIELGFMFSDRQLLTTQPDLLAGGIVQGVLCYLEPNDPNILATLQAPTPAPPTPPPTASAGA